MKKFMVLVAALALVATSALTAAAADWNFYGNARIQTFIVDTETINPSTPAAATDRDFTTLQHNLFGTSRIGATTQVSDELTGGFEVGMASGSFAAQAAGTPADSVYLRHIWGEWNFGAGSLMVGRNWAPLNYFYSNMVGGDDGLTSYGGVYSGRRDMIRLAFGGLQIAAVAPTDEGAVGGYTVEHDIPQLQVNYNMVMDNFSFNVGGGYNQFEYATNPATGGKSYDLDSWIVSGGLKASFGAAYLSGSLYLSQNAAQFGMGNGAGYNAVTDRFVDTDTMGYTLVAGYKLSDMFAFEVGYGARDGETFNAVTNQNDDDDLQAYYVQSTITLAPGFFIVPEIGQIDHEEAGALETTYYGLKWQINF